MADQLTKAKALTTRAVDAIKPDPSRRIEVPDAAMAGLYLVVQPTGAKGWALRYRFAGRPVKLTLGRWPAMGLAAARAAASEAVDTARHGTDPAAAKASTKAARREAQLTGRDKVATLVEQFDKRHLAALKSGTHARRFLDRFVVPAWGERDVSTITRRDVLDLLDGIADSGRAVTANRVLAHARKFFGWCVERDILTASPAVGIKSPAKEASRDRVLTDDEVRWLWQACGRVGQPWGAMARLLLLTGQRLNEVAQMSDGELQAGVWHLAASRVKNARAHDVPLSPAARDVLAGVERIKGSASFVFTTSGDAPVQGFHRARARLAAAMEAVASEERGEPVDIPHWGFHDLRRTAATGLARLGTPVRVTEAILNHVSGSGGGIVAVYQRHDYAKEKAGALEAWGRCLTVLVEGKDDNVVRLGRMVS